jgi:predicted nucleotidyltransferase
MGLDLEPIAKRHGILLALQFGSLVSGKTHARSDVDIAVLLDHSEVLFEQFSDLLGDLQRLFPEQEVDLAILNHADPLFLKKITDDCRILYGAPGELQKLKIYAFKRHQDHKKFFEMERRYAATYVATKAAAQ